MASWDYCSDNHGPTCWHHHFPQAAGSRQSPIDICEPVHDPNLPPIGVRYEPVETAGLKNTGASVQLDFDCAARTANNNIYHNILDTIPEPTCFVENGPLGDMKYTLQQLHFHWGTEPSCGSEHTVKGKSYAAELHLVHWNSTKYNSFEESVKHDDGLAVLGVFLQVGSSCHSGIEKLTKHFEELKFKNQAVNFGKFNPQCLLPQSEKVEKRTTWAKNNFRVKHIIPATSGPI